MDSKILEAAIKQVSQNITDEGLALMVSCAAGRELKKGEQVLKEGGNCRDFYLVDSGHLRTYYNKDGVAINLNFTFEGEFTANIQSIKSKQGSEYIIEAGEDATVWILNIDELIREFNASSEVGVFIRRLAIRILMASEEHSNLFKMYTPTERYRYIEKNNPQLLQRISLSQIASYLGVARETLSRIRGKNH